MKHQKYGFTFIEIFISALLLLLITIGIASIIKSGHEGTTRILAETPLHRQTRDALHWLAKDIERASANSLGNLIINGGFELSATGSNQPPRYWDSVTTGTPGRMIYHYLSGASTVVRTGKGSIQLTSYFGDDAAIPKYNSNKPNELRMTLRKDHAYMITGWVLTRSSGHSSARGIIRLVAGADSPSITNSGSTTDQWNFVSCRYPDTGVLTADITGAYIQLSVTEPSDTGSGTVCFDDISLTSICTLLASDLPGEQSMVACNNPSDNGAGLLAEVWIKPDAPDTTPYLALMRYRVTPSRELVREEIESFDTGTNLWDIDDNKTRIMCKNVARLAFSYFNVAAPNSSPSPSPGPEEIDKQAEVIGIDLACTDVVYGKQRRAQYSKKVFPINP